MVDSGAVVRGVGGAAGLSGARAHAGTLVVGVPGWSRSCHHTRLQTAAIQICARLARQPVGAAGRRREAAQAPAKETGMERRQAEGAQRRGKVFTASMESDAHWRQMRGNGGMWERERQSETSRGTT